MKYLKFFLLFFYIIIPKFLSATTLQEALVSAYETNPNIIAAREELKKKDEEIYKAISGFLPKLDYEAKDTRSKTDTKWVSGQLTKEDQWINSHAKKTSVSLEQNIFSGGKSIIAVKIANYVIEAARAELIAKEQEILFSAIKAYFDVIYTKQMVEINKDNVLAYEQKYNSIKSKFNAGFSKLADLAAALSRKSDAETNLAQANAEYNSALASYLEVIGLNASNIYPLNNYISKPILSELDLLQKALKDNPLLVNALNRQKAADLQINYNVASMLPTIDIGGSINKIWEEDSPNYSKPYSNIKSIYVNVKVPLYNKGVEYSNVRFSKADAAKLKYEVKNIKASITQNATKLWHEYTAAKEAVNSAEEAVNSGIIALNGKQKEYAEGLASFSEVLEFQEDLFKYKLKLASAKNYLMLKFYEMIKLTGKLTAKELSLPTKYYDCMENYNKIKFKAVGF